MSSIEVLTHAAEARRSEARVALETAASHEASAKAARAKAADAVRLAEAIEADIRILTGERPAEAHVFAGAGKRGKGKAE